MSNAQHEEKNNSFIFNDLPKETLDESYYHGFLPREDLPYLLEKVINLNINFFHRRS